MKALSIGRKFLAENSFENIGRLKFDDLFDLKSLVNAVQESDEPSYPAACDAGTEETYAVRYDRDGNAEAILLGMSGDDVFENTDPNAQGLYLAARRLFPGVIAYGGSMGPAGFVPKDLVGFCGLGSLSGATVRASYNDCESGPSEIPLSREQQKQILDTVRSTVVTGKVSACVTTGGFRSYDFFRGDQYLGCINIYNDLFHRTEELTENADRNRPHLGDVPDAVFSGTVCCAPARGRLLMPLSQHPGTVPCSRRGSICRCFGTAPAGCRSPCLCRKLSKA